MRNVTRSYEALRLRCQRCDYVWPAVYEVTRWLGGDGVAEVRYAGADPASGWPWDQARCPHCGGSVAPADWPAVLPAQRTTPE